MTLWKVHWKERMYAVGANENIFYDLESVGWLKVKGIISDWL